MIYDTDPREISKNARPGERKKSIGNYTVRILGHDPRVRHGLQGRGRARGDISHGPLAFFVESHRALRRLTRLMESPVACLRSASVTRKIPRRRASPSSPLVGKRRGRRRSRLTVPRNGIVAGRSAASRRRPRRNCEKSVPRCAMRSCRHNEERRDAARGYRCARCRGRSARRFRRFSRETNRLTLARLRLSHESSSKSVETVIRR